MILRKSFSAITLLKHNCILRKQRIKRKLRDGKFHLGQITTFYKLFLSSLYSSPLLFTFRYLLKSSSEFLGLCFCLWGIFCGFGLGFFCWLGFFFDRVNNLSFLTLLHNEKVMHPKMRFE